MLADSYGALSDAGQERDQLRLIKIHEERFRDSPPTGVITHHTVSSQDCGRQYHGVWCAEVIFHPELGRFARDTEVEISEPFRPEYRRRHLTTGCLVDTGRLFACFAAQLV